MLPAVEKVEKYEVMISCPNDVWEERRAVEDALNDWNRENGSDHKAVLIPRYWKNDVAPSQAAPAQEMINHQLCEKCHILIAIFGERMGEPVGDYPCGTVAEIQTFKKLGKGKNVLIYFKESIPLRERNEEEQEQLDRLGQYQKELYEDKTTGVCGTYTSPDDLGMKIFCKVKDFLEPHKGKNTKAEPDTVTLEIFNGYIDAILERDRIDQNELARRLGITKVWLKLARTGRYLLPDAVFHNFLNVLFYYPGKNLMEQFCSSAFYPLLGMLDQCSLLQKGDKQKIFITVRAFCEGSKAIIAENTPLQIDEGDVLIHTNLINHMPEKLEIMSVTPYLYSSYAEPVFILETKEWESKSKKNIGFQI